jgi:hypothetical protein
MGNQTDYFNRIGYNPKWFIGDRVLGYWNKIPFVGTVGNDTLINNFQGPRVSVHLDLPIKYKDTVYTILFVKPADLKVFK